MISTRLGTLPTPRQSSRSLQRRLKLATDTIHKQTNQKIRKAKSYTKAAIKRQYYMHYAFSDLQRSIARNEDTFITSAIMIAVISYAAAISAVESMLLFLNTAYGISQVTGIDVGVMILAAVCILVTLYAWVLSFVINTMSIAIMDGANRRKSRSTRQTMRLGLRQATRVTAAWFTLGALIGVPLLIAGGIGILYLQVNEVSEEGLLALIPRAIIAAIAWVCIVLMQFSLAPQAALFEQNLSLRQVFSRARKLVIGRGRIFILLGYCAISCGLFIAYKLSQVLEKVLMLNKWVALSFFTIGLAMLSNGMLVTLYHKRRLARK